MKSQFFEFDYYMDDAKLESIYKSSDTIFVIDTNILLDLYSYQQSTRDAIYQSFTKVSEKLWSPHQVMLEYSKNRNKVIFESKKNFENISSHLEKFIISHNCSSKELATFNTNYGKNYPELRTLFSDFQEKSKVQTEKTITSLRKDAESIINKITELKKGTVTLTGQDSVREKLYHFYPDEKVGDEFTINELEEIYLEGEQRYLQSIPPGYKDKDKEGEEYYHRGKIYKGKFGDLLIYKQILKHCKQLKIKNVFFVSRDAKEDWREKVPYENDKYFGARRELRAEAYLEANIENFLILEVEDFLKLTNKNTLDDNIKEDLLTVRQIHNDFDDLRKYRDMIKMELNELDKQIGYVDEKKEILEFKIIDIKIKMNEVSSELSMLGNKQKEGLLEKEFELVSISIKNLMNERASLQNKYFKLISEQGILEEEYISLRGKKDFLNSILNEPLEVIKSLSFKQSANTLEERNQIDLSTKNDNESVSKGKIKGYGLRGFKSYINNIDREK